MQQKKKKMSQQDKAVMFYNFALNKIRNAAFLQSTGKRHVEFALSKENPKTEDIIRAKSFAKSNFKSSLKLLITAVQLLDLALKDGPNDKLRNKIESKKKGLESNFKYLEKQLKVEPKL